MAQDGLIFDATPEARSSVDGRHAAGMEAAEAVGTVKWFHRRKGYGFLVTGTSDVFVHVSVLKEAGRTMLFEGDVVRCAVVASRKGRRARRILDVTPVVPEYGWARATLRGYFPRHGYGFFRVESETEDIFVGAGTIESAGLCPRRQLRDDVEIRYRMRDGGLAATEIRPIPSAR